MLSEIIAQIAKEILGCTFVGVKNYIASTGRVVPEVSNFTLVLNASYENAKQKSIAILESAEFGDDVYKINGVELPKNEVRDILVESLKNPNKKRSQSQIQAYKYVAPGIKVHKQTGDYYLFGKVANKVVVKKGEFKEVKSRPLTIAKRILAKELELPHLQFRSLIIPNSQRVNLMGETVVVDYKD